MAPSDVRVPKVESALGVLRLPRSFGLRTWGPAWGAAQGTVSALQPLRDPAAPRRGVEGDPHALTPYLPSGVPARGRSSRSDHASGSCGTVHRGGSGSRRRGPRGPRHPHSLALALGGEGPERAPPPRLASPARAEWGRAGLVLPLPVAQPAGLSGRGRPWWSTGLSAASRRLNGAPITPGGRTKGRTPALTQLQLRAGRCCQARPGAGRPGRLLDLEGKLEPSFPTWGSPAGRKKEGASRGCLPPGPRPASRWGDQVLQARCSREWESRTSPLSCPMES